VLLQQRPDKLGLADPDLQPRRQGHHRDVVVYVFAQVGELRAGRAHPTTLSAIQTARFSQSPVESTVLASNNAFLYTLSALFLNTTGIK
jgi:hypothetical protein